MQAAKKVGEVRRPEANARPPAPKTVSGTNENLPFFKCLRLKQLLGSEFETCGFQLSLDAPDSYIIIYSTDFSWIFNPRSICQRTTRGI